MSFIALFIITYSVLQKEFNGTISLNSKISQNLFEICKVISTQILIL